MGNDKLLNHIKNQVKDHKMSIDHDALWSAVQPAIARTPAGANFAVTPPIWLQFILNGGFVIALFATTLMIAGFDTDPDQAITSQSAHQELIQSEGVTTTKMTRAKDHQARLSVASDLILDKETSLAKNSTVETPLVARAKINVTKEYNSTITKTENNENFSVKTKQTTNANTTFLDLQNIETSNNTDRRHQEVIPNANRPATTTQEYGEQSSSKEAVAYDAMQSLEPLSLLKCFTPLSDKLNSNLERSFDFSPTDCPTFGNRGPNPWGIFAYTGPNMTFKSLSTTNSEFDAYREERESTESSLESFRTGLGVKYAFQNGLYIKAGIEHLRINEKFNTSFTRDTTRVLEDQIIQIIVHAVGDTTFVRGDLPITETITQNWEVYNKFNAISFPISLGYEMYNRKWSYFAEAGLIINTSFNFSGAIMNQAGRPTQDPAIFKDKTGLGLHLTAGIAYSLSPRIKVNLSPSYFTILDPINNQGNSIDQEYGTLGLLLGGEYKF